MLWGGSRGECERERVWGLGVQAKDGRGINSERGSRFEGRQVPPDFLPVHLPPPPLFQNPRQAGNCPASREAKPIRRQPLCDITCCQADCHIAPAGAARRCSGESQRATLPPEASRPACLPECCIQRERVLYPERGGQTYRRQKFRRRDRDLDGKGSRETVGKRGRAGSAGRTGDS